MKGMKKLNPDLKDLKNAILSNDEQAKQNLRKGTNKHFLVKAQTSKLSPFAEPSYIYDKHRKLKVWAFDDNCGGTSGFQKLVKAVQRLGSVHSGVKCKAYFDAYTYSTKEGETVMRVLLHDAKKNPGW
jgi:hypothetical protein